jgi:hypothetical protein
MANPLNILSILEQLGLNAGKLVKGLPKTTQTLRTKAGDITSELPPRLFTVGGAGETALNDAKYSGVLKNILGSSKTPRLVPEDYNLMSNRVDRLGGLKAYNPLVSVNKGRITLPRVGALGAGIYGGANLLSAGSPATSGLTQEQIDALNAANLAGVLPSMKAQFMPDESYYAGLQDYINTISAGNAIGGNYSGGGATDSNVAGGLRAAATGAEQRLSGGAGTGLAGMTPVSGTAATMPSALRETGKISDTYSTKIAQAKSTAGASNKLANAYNQSLAARMNMGLQLSKMQDTRQAQQDWRNYLTKNAANLTPAMLGQYATQFTGNEPGLADVQTQWNALSTEDLQKLAAKNIFSPADLYVELRKNNPSQYGG